MTSKKVHFVTSRQLPICGASFGMKLRSRCAITTEFDKVTCKACAKGMRRAAMFAAEVADLAAGIYVDAKGHQHAPCSICGCDCSTHPDAAHGLDRCGDCGGATCEEHRDQTTAARCTRCQ